MKNKDVIVYNIAFSFNMGNELEARRELRKEFPGVSAQEFIKIVRVNQWMNKEQLRRIMTHERSNWYT